MHSTGKELTSREIQQRVLDGVNAIGHTDVDDVPGYSSADIVRRTQFTRDLYDTTRSSEALPTEFKSKLDACRKAYEEIGMARNAVDLMADFASEGLQIIHTNKKVQKFLNNWREYSNLDTVINNVFTAGFRDGNVCIYEYHHDIGSEIVKTLREEKNKVVKKTAKGKKGKKVAKAAKDDTSTIPTNFELLNIRQIDVTGVNYTFGRVLTYTVPNDTKQFIDKQQKSSQEKEVFDLLDKEYISEVKKAQEIILNRNRYSEVHLKKYDWEKWANPYLFAVLDDLNFKRKMRDMDRSVADSVINAIVIFKLGKG